jgi:hypothetical protein
MCESRKLFLSILVSLMVSLTFIGWSKHAQSQEKYPTRSNLEKWASRHSAARVQQKVILFFCLHSWRGGYTIYQSIVAPWWGYLSSY